jgi:hypothetical protein
MTVQVEQERKEIWEQEHPITSEDQRIAEDMKKKGKRSKSIVAVNKKQEIVTTGTRSKAYLDILQEARQLVGKTKDIIARMIQQGKRDGLNPKLIREDIDSLAEASGLSDRQKQRLLPTELKYTQFSNKPKLKADKMSASVVEPDTSTTTTTSTIETAVIWT